MAKNKNKMTFIEVIKLIGYGTIGAVALYFFQDRLDVKDDIVDAKDAQIEYLELLQVSNFNSIIKELKESYETQIAIYKTKIKKLESSGDSLLIMSYKDKILSLETKLNLIKQVADDFTEEIIDRFGSDLQFDEIKPFAYFRVFDRSDSTQYDFKSLYENWYYSFIINRMKFGIIPPPTVDEWPCPYIVSGTHSPLYYSFDSVDLRTATFRSTDLRGVDLSTVIFNDETKFPLSK